MPSFEPAISPAVHWTGRVLSGLGYLGGAMATHLRAGSPLVTHLMFGFYLGLLLWGGLWLRDPVVRALLPSRSAATT